MGQSGEHKHKMACGKVVTALRRLGAAIASTEALLPSLKTRTGEGEYLE